jgi:hypothetical protein
MRHLQGRRVVRMRVVTNFEVGTGSNAQIRHRVRSNPFPDGSCTSGLQNLRCKGNQARPGNGSRTISISISKSIYTRELDGDLIAPSTGLPQQAKHAQTDSKFKRSRQKRCFNAESVEFRLAI